jgi:hypothetical protein
MDIPTLPPTMPTADPVPPAKPAKGEFIMVGGGQPTISQADLKPKIKGIRVQATFRHDERELTDDRPIYEIPLMDAFWRLTGGEVVINAMWLPPRMMYSRLFDMSEYVLRTEAVRLDTTYRVPSPNGAGRNMFKEIYGREGDAIDGFYRVVAKQARAWNELMEKMRREGRVNGAIAQDELQAICNIALPEQKFVHAEGIEMISDIALPEDPVARELEEMGISDRHASLRRYLSGCGFEAEVYMEFLTAIGDGERVTPAMLGSMRSLTGKTSEQKKLARAYAKWSEEQQASTVAAPESLGV